MTQFTIIWSAWRMRLELKQVEGETKDEVAHFKTEIQKSFVKPG